MSFFYVGENAYSMCARGDQQEERSDSSLPLISINGTKKAPPIFRSGALYLSKG